jgi:hypothetical protein
LAGLVAIVGILLAAGALVEVGGRANASSLEPYLVRYLPGPSCGSNSTRLLGTGYYANPENWNSGWHFSKETTSDVGNTHYVTDTYYENGVTVYAEYAKCADYKTTYIEAPTSYVHRHRTQRWACGAGSCQYLGTSTTGWSSGTTFS